MSRRGRICKVGKVTVESAAAQAEHAFEAACALGDGCEACDRANIPRSWRGLHAGLLGAPMVTVAHDMAGLAVVERFAAEHGAEVLYLSPQCDCERQASCFAAAIVEASQKLGRPIIGVQPAPDPSGRLPGWWLTQMPPEMALTVAAPAGSC